MSFIKFSVLLFLLGANTIYGSNSFLRSEGQQSNSSIQRRRTQFDNDASPENSENSCPEYRPYMGDKCTEPSTVCAYTSFTCEGESEVHYINKCYCSPTHVGDGLEYECYEMVIECEDSIPAIELRNEPEREIEPRNEPEAVCPESMPADDDICSINTPTPCLYDVVLCDDTDEINHRHRCFCENEKFKCMQNIILCSEKKEDDASVDEIEDDASVDEIEEDDGATIQTFPPVAECTPTPPVDMECSEESPNPCNYGPIQCVGSDTIHYSTTCVCDGEKYVCKALDILIICEDGYVKSCTEELFECPGGTFVGRDSESNCKFKPCPVEDDREGNPDYCPEDIFVCADGSIVSRDITNKCEFPPCAKPTYCLMDLYPCPDGTMVGRDIENNCEYKPCPETKYCPKDLRECPDGTVVGRDVKNNCEFKTCPDQDSATKPLSCTMDVKICRDGKSLMRDAANNCQFPLCPEETEYASTCPESPPKSGEDKCYSDSLRCDYNPFSCPGESSTTFLRQCKCENSVFWCLVMDVWCAEDPHIQPNECPEDLWKCKDGTTVSRDVNLNCEFPKCPQIADDNVCAHDAQECPDGSWVGRDEDNDCQFEPCPEPPKPEDDCRECSDNGNKGMIRKGKSCSGFNNKQLKKKCAKPKWQKKEFCQYSCFKAGYGYGDEVCCELASE